VIKRVVAADRRAAVRRTACDGYRNQKFRHPELVEGSASSGVADIFPGLIL
jgi:hypothetical protein